MITTRLLGSLAFQLEDQPLSHLLTGRIAALLSYLAVTRQPQHRSVLATLLWHNVSEQKARSNLRYALRNLRKVAGDYIIVDGETVAFNQDLPSWVDVVVFSDYMGGLAAHSVQLPEAPILQESLNLYAGEFLVGFRLEGAPAFDDWVLTQRRHLHDLFIRGLQLCTRLHLALNEYEEALALNQHLLTLEPWREETHRQRMLLFASSGQRSAALQQFISCCQILQEELDVPPMQETVTLYEQIKSGQWFAKHHAADHRQGLPVAVASSPLGLSMPIPATAGLNGYAHSTQAHQERGAQNENDYEQGHHVLRDHVLRDYVPRFDLGSMPLSAQFFGRQPELAMLHSWIGQEQCPLIALFGISGQGKSALAGAFVQEIVDAQRSHRQHENVHRQQISIQQSNIDMGGPVHRFDHVIWRSLHETSSCTDVLQGWLQQLDDERQERVVAPNFDQLVTRLFSILQERRCLLVLDGLEATMAHPTYDAYSTLLSLFFQRPHRSCLLLTSHIRPQALTPLDERNSAYRCLTLEGLTVDDATTLLAAHGIMQDPVAYQQLHKRYAGNPLLLNRAANLISSIFDNDVSAFLKEEGFLLTDWSKGPAKRLAQLSSVEREIIQVLAKAGMPLSRQTLWEHLASENLTLNSQALDSLTQEELPEPSAKRNYFCALQNLQRMFLIRWIGAEIRLSSIIDTYLKENGLKLR